MIGMMNNFLRYIFVMLVLVLCNNACLLYTSDAADEL